MLSPHVNGAKLRLDEINFSQPFKISLALTPHLFFQLFCGKRARDSTLL